MVDTANADSPLGPDAAYAAHLAQGRFMLQRCDACARYVFFPRVMCPHCGGPQLLWAKASGGATVYSVTVVRRKPQHGGDYNVVLVDLDEGPRMMSRIEGASAGAVCIGMRVRARIASAGDTWFVVFDPAEEASR
ncbi:MAG TPA: OB-fold domain-containing protein [Bordetella sp.]|nr:OB-fold domain-containing protein [Bordetella sp.]